MNNKYEGRLWIKYDSILYGNTSKGITNKFYISQPGQDSLTGS